MDKLTQVNRRIKVLLRLHEQLGIELDELYRFLLEQEPQISPSDNGSDENVIG